MSSAGATRILQVGASDRAGGAERVMMDLHAEYLRRGLHSRVAVGFKRTTDATVFELPNDASRSAWARSLAGMSAKLARRGGTGRRTLARAALYLSDPVRYSAVLAGHEDMDYPGTRRLLDLEPELPDTLHLHNLHGGYFDLNVLPSLAAAVPTVLTLHDAWLFTGHCAHPFDCPGWRSGCETCPHLDIPIAIRRDAAAANLRTKRAILACTSAAIVSPSAWLMHIAEDAGALAGERLARVIPNGVDTTVFTPGDRGAARDTLGLPAEATIVLVAGQGLPDNPYKDFATLVAALPAVAREHSDVLLVALGSDRSEALEGLPVRHVPFVEDSETVAAYLRAADVYVHPARAENLPLAIIEAMACGTPVVASEVGGIPELIEHDTTGLLVPPGDPARLAEAVSALISDETLRARLASAALERVHARHTLFRQADAYLALYAAVIGQCSART